MFSWEHAIQSLTVALPFSSKHKKLLIESLRPYCMCTDYQTAPFALRKFSFETCDSARLPNRGLLIPVA